MIAQAKFGSALSKHVASRFIRLHQPLDVYISNTRKSVLSGIQTLRSGLKKRGAVEFF